MAIYQRFTAQWKGLGDFLESSSQRIRSSFLSYHVRDLRNKPSSTIPVEPAVAVLSISEASQAHSCNQGSSEGPEALGRQASDAASSGDDIPRHADPGMPDTPASVSTADVPPSRDGSASYKASAFWAPQQQPASQWPPSTGDEFSKEADDRLYAAMVRSHESLMHFVADIAASSDVSYRGGGKKTGQLDGVERDVSGGRTLFLSDRDNGTIASSSSMVGVRTVIYSGGSKDAELGGTDSQAPDFLQLPGFSGRHSKAVPLQELPAETMALVRATAGRPKALERMLVELLQAQAEGVRADRAAARLRDEATALGLGGAAVAAGAAGRRGSVFGQADRWSADIARSGGVVAGGAAPNTVPIEGEVVGCVGIRRRRIPLGERRGGSNVCAGEEAGRDLDGTTRLVQERKVRWGRGCTAQ